MCRSRTVKARNGRSPPACELRRCWDVKTDGRGRSVGVSTHDTHDSTRIAKLRLKADRAGACAPVHDNGRERSNELVFESVVCLCKEIARPAAMPSNSALGWAALVGRVPLSLLSAAPRRLARVCVPASQTAQLGVRSVGLCAGTPLPPPPPAPRLCSHDSRRVHPVQSGQPHLPQGGVGWVVVVWGAQRAASSTTRWGGWWWCGVHSGQPHLPQGGVGGWVCPKRAASSTTRWGGWWWWWDVRMRMHQLHWVLNLSPLPPPRSQAFSTRKEAGKGNDPLHSASVFNALHAMSKQARQGRGRGRGALLHSTA
jgi:hypothetical protein